MRGLAPSEIHGDRRDIELRAEPQTTIVVPVIVVGGLRLFTNANRPTFRQSCRRTQARCVPADFLQDCMICGFRKVLPELNLSMCGVETQSAV